MKKLELSVTDENLISTLYSDIANRNEDIKYFIELLDNIEGTMSIAINGDWGSGKTFFVRQAILIMTYLNKELTFANRSINDGIEKIFEKHSNIFKEIRLKINLVPIYYNAWQSDNHSDPILSIIYTIVKNMGSEGKEKISASDNERMKSILNIINLPFISNIGDAVESFQKKDCTQVIIDSEEITSILNSIIEEKVAEGKKIVMFIDELDRCNPQYAVKTLERIKHFFNNEHIIFVFSTNLEQLSKTISIHYGNGFASSRYLSKFFDYIIEIPQFDIDSFLFSFDIIKKSDYYFDIITSSIAKQFKFSMRDCVRYLQSMESLRTSAVGRNGNGFSNDRGNFLMTIVFAPILLALKIKSLEDYLNVINGNGLEILNEIINNNDKINLFLSDLLYDDEKISDDEKHVLFEKLYNSLFNESNEEGFYNRKISINRSQVNFFLKKISKLR